MGAASQETNAAIAFVREAGARGVWIVESCGEERRLMRGEDYRPSWSPDGKRIAFQRFDDGGSDLYAMDADGSRMRALTRRGGYYHPAWSPDGTQIACGRVVKGRGEICIPRFLSPPPAATHPLDQARFDEFWLTGPF